MSDPALEPDAEHVLVAVLALEGVVTKLLTTNWDPLVERAARALSENGDLPFSVVAHADELDGKGDRYLVKIHGCAERAVRDEARYRRYLVATRDQIATWGTDAGEPGTIPLKELAVTLLRDKRVLFLGLSGVDDNLLRVATEAVVGRDRSYAPSPPKVAFVSERITEPQRDILSHLHDSDSLRSAEAASLVTPCAKPLLAGLFVEVIRSKVALLIEHADGDLLYPEHLVDFLQSFVDACEKILVEEYDAVNDHDERWRRFAREVIAFLGRFTLLYRDQRWEHESVYVPLLPEPVAALRQQGGAVSERGLHWLLLATAALHSAEADGKWEISIDHNKPSHFVISRPDRDVRVFLTRDSTRGRHKIEVELADDLNDDGVLFIYTNEAEPKHRRGKTSLLRRTPGGDREAGSVGEIWLEDLALDSTDVGSFVELMELSLAEEAA